MSIFHNYTMEEFYDYSNRLHFNTIIDITVNIFIGYIVLKHSTKAMGNYKYYILLTIFCAFLMDFHISFIFGPYVMLPAPMFCGAGVIARNMGHFWGQYFNYALLHIAISSAGLSIVAGLFYQLSSLNGNVKFFHSIKGVTIIFLFMIFYSLPSFLIIFPIKDFDETAEYIKQYNIYVYDVFIAAKSCNAIILDFKGKLHYCALAFQIFAVWIVMCFVAFKIHRKLQGLKNVLSPQTLKARRQLLIALCFQMTIPFILIGIPLAICMLSVIINIKRMYLVSGYLFNMVALHSMVNALSILFNIAPYRKAVTNGFKRIFGIKERPTITITVTEYSGRSFTSLPRK